ncbi:hypothetical protein RV00_GL001897 [Enterococcus devriesei]|uniref:Uncharacterized protein n=1 Tax=Enterococcus devriesei TaxID=319970 RepID=A0A1L8SX52_9ENTE|nr:hypothetical protein RV00_GL001897 [Enterococcus devriesei]
MFHSLKGRNEKVNGNHLKRTKKRAYFLIITTFLSDWTKRIE